MNERSKVAVLATAIINKTNKKRKKERKKKKKERVIITSPTFCTTSVKTCNKRPCCVPDVTQACSLKKHRLADRACKACESGGSSCRQRCVLDYAHGCVCIYVCVRVSVMLVCVYVCVCVCVWNVYVCVCVYVMNGALLKKNFTIPQPEDPAEQISTWRQQQGH